MIKRYSNPEIEKIFSQKQRLNLFIKLQKYVCEYYISKSTDNKNLISQIKIFDTIDIDKLSDTVSEFEKTTKHETLAMLYALTQQLPAELKPFLHKGLTSSDFLDSIFSIQLKNAIEETEKKLIVLLEFLKEIAVKHKVTKMIGRSHGMAGEIISFGFVMLNFVDEGQRCLSRLCRVKKDCLPIMFSGAMGNYAHIDMEIEEFISAKTDMTSAKISSQIIARDLYADTMFAYTLTACFLDRLATEIRNLSQSGIAEVSEGLTKGQGGSSAMPHKVNPILSENINGLSRLIKGYLQPVLDNTALWNQRDMSHSSVERIAFEDAITLTCFSLDRMSNVIKNLYVNEQNMLDNIDREDGKYLSQSLLLTLIDKGLSREEVYAEIQNITSKNQAITVDFLSNNNKFKLTKSEIDQLFNLEKFVKNIPKIFNKII